MSKREFLQQAKVYETGMPVIGRYLSEKLDGMRAFWDGGVTRGKWADEVPFANVEKDKVRHKATGLWSRRAKVIHAPAFWLDSLPEFPLDGELFLRDSDDFQKLMSICRTIYSDNGWDQVGYFVYDSPRMDIVASEEYCTANDIYIYRHLTFSQTLSFLEKHLTCNDYVRLHEQTKISSESQIFDRMSSVKEGLMIRSDCLWTPIRHTGILKVKNYFDGECVVMGYRSGAGKYLGCLGSLICKFGDVWFNIGTGINDDERELHSSVRIDVPDVVLPMTVVSKYFPRGSKITFRYAQLSDDGVPIQPRYDRKRLD